MSSFIDTVISYSGKIFGISTTLFQWPALLHSLFIPLVLFTYAMKLLFDQIGIFHSDSVNWLIGLVISFASLVLISSAGPFFAGAAIFMICINKIHGTWGVFIGFSFGLAYIRFINPYLVAFLS